MSVRVLHVIPALGVGGGARALLGCARASAEAGFRHRVVSLRPASEAMAGHARRQGLAVLEAPPRDRLLAELERADIVHVHFWNSPELYELLRAPLPAVRLVIWAHVGGAHPPQVIVPELAELADVLVVTSPLSAELEALDGRRDVELIWPVGDPERSDGTVRRPHEGFVVGYVGTVDPVKMHPDFVALSSRVRLPDVRFVVCGSGGGFAALARAAEGLGTREQFDLRGYVEDVASAFAEFDVFGYPLREGNYSTGELVLQEAMRMGVPPVVLPHGGPARMVRDGETGIVAADEGEYVSALELLARDAELRVRLGKRAREHARRTWSLEISGERWTALYRSLLDGPKRARRWPGAEVTSPAEAFIAALGAAGSEFRESLDARAPEPTRLADRAIAEAHESLAYPDGGLLDYRRRYPSDPHLRLWSGFVLAAGGRPALAAGELAAAVRLGCQPERVMPYLEALTAA